MTVKIRNASTKDISSILFIENNCFLSEKISQRQLIYLLTKGKCIVLVGEKYSKIVSYCIYLKPKLPKPARLYSIAVLENFRGKGIAKQLITYGLKNIILLGYNRIRLEVRSSELNVQKIYTQMGFEVICKLPSYYENSKEGLRMELNLKK